MHKSFQLERERRQKKKCAFTLMVDEEIIAKSLGQKIKDGLLHSVIKSRVWKFSSKKDCENFQIP